ncbi:Arylsulfatase [Lignipirellula cremea]|uniref:Arylsulfatase n=2 Tax=Lignipirellula cremea TaxID=2528010 RepID=A0A518DYA1_9BACT|nr:Arylsulfatase [Lignipirellula cremea]
MLLLITAISALSAGQSAQAAKQQARPNIVLLMCDDMGYEGVSAYGSQTYKTPHLDRLASQGLLFNHCYSTPICTTSRVQIMTGKYNHRNYVRFGFLDTNQITFGNLLRDAGYATAIAGKWQLGGDGKTVRDFGFDNYCLWQVSGGRDSRFWDPRIEQDGKLLDGLEEKFGPDVFCDYLCNFIHEKKEKPFFVYYPMVLVHWPFVPTPDSPPGGSRERSGKYDGQNGGVEYFPDMVNYLDKIVGRLIDQLKQDDLVDNTLFLFTCDNGCATNIVSQMGDQTIHGGKASLPDAGTHAALVAYWPAVIKPTGPINTLVDLSDILPTLVAATGAKLPADGPIDGVSFLPVLRGETQESRPWIFCHYSRNGLPREPKAAEKREEIIAKQQREIQAKTLGRFARTQRYKLYEDGRFYDISQDVLEKKNLPPGSSSAEAEAARKTLQAVHDQMGPWEPFSAGKDD